MLKKSIPLMLILNALTLSQTFAASLVQGTFSGTDNLGQSCVVTLTTATNSSNVLIGSFTISNPSITKNWTAGGYESGSPSFDVAVETDEVCPNPSGPGYQVKQGWSNGTYGSGFLFPWARRSLDVSITFDAEGNAQTFFADAKKGRNYQKQMLGFPITCANLKKN